MASTRSTTGNSKPRVHSAVSTTPERKRQENKTSSTTTKTPTTTKRSGGGVTKSGAASRAPNTHHKRKPHLGDKIEGAAGKVVGTVTRKPGKEGRRHQEDARHRRQEQPVDAEERLKDDIQSPISPYGPQFHGHTCGNYLHPASFQLAVDLHCNFTGYSREKARSLCFRFIAAWRAACCLSPPAPLYLSLPFTHTYDDE
ncbi:uncharacterized protein PG986_012448 [Apiospora aurea]|uniref:Uncharacterized protein n=1 Tax=Apiospora aurea TaxID=335848 RepID=A0ABR1Q024_9PEZI